MKQFHIFISGRVQGVFFISNTVRKARELNIRGWVKNLTDSRVEVVAQGATLSMNEFLKFLRKGPYGARVDNAEIIEEEAKESYNGFSIKHDNNII